MDDLISRTELKERLMYMTRYRANSEIGEPRCGLTRRLTFHMSEIMRTVIEMPAAEPERKKATWQALVIFENHVKVRCTSCGDIWTKPKAEQNMNYCPNCGAYMRGGDDDQN